MESIGISNNHVMEVKNMKPQLNMAKHHKLTMVVNQNKPKRCKMCGSRQKWVVLVKNNNGTIGTITFCTNCCANMVNPPKTMHNIVDYGEMVTKAQRLVETQLGG
jgi:superfamily II helicase